MEARILELLGRYSSLDWDQLKDLIFSNGTFSDPAERELQTSLERLAGSGRIVAGGRFGPYWVRPSIPATGSRREPKPAPRARAAPPASLKA